ncbi:MAG: hypothetical protein EKK46_07595 [Rhodocyclaceae bacterium]|nr:MAG: hypothetical protein EKK46_07595 [Rhodocyclaceae bacterium]
MSRLKRFGIACLLLFPLWGRTAEPLSVRLVGDDAGFSAQVMLRIEALIRKNESDVLINDPEHAGSVHRRLLIGVGAKGVRAAEGAAPDLPVLSVLPPRQSLDPAPLPGGKAIGTINGDMPLNRIFNFVQLLTQKRGTSIGLIAGPFTQSRLSRLEASANERGLRLLVEKVERENNVGPAVDRLVQQAGILLALPDPVAHTAGTVPPLLLITYRAGVPVIGYSEAYLRAGAVAALYSTPEQIAQQVVDMIAAWRQGKPFPSVQGLKYFTVGSNPSVARSLGLSLPPPEELEARLKQMKE